MKELMQNLNIKNIAIAVFIGLGVITYSFKEVLIYPYVSYAREIGLVKSLGTDSSKIPLYSKKCWEEVYLDKNNSLVIEVGCTEKQSKGFLMKNFMEKKIEQHQEKSKNPSFFNRNEKYTF